MKKLLILFLLLASFGVFAASPSFQQFDTNTFITQNGVSVKADLAPPIQIIRGTNIIRVGSFASMTNVWQPGDVVRLGVTNTLTGDINCNVPNITFTGIGSGKSFIGTVSNKFYFTTNSVSFSGISMLCATPNTLSSNANNDAVGLAWFGPMPVTNISLSDMRVVNNQLPLALWNTNGVANGNCSLTATDCTFEGGGGWSGARCYLLTNAALVNFTRCRFIWSGIANAATNTRPCALRAEYGDITILNCYFDAPGYAGVNEQIGIYAANDVRLHVRGGISWGPFSNPGIQGAGHMFVEATAVIDDAGLLSSADYYFNGTRSTNDVATTVPVFSGSNIVSYARVDGSRWKLGTDELNVTGTNGVSVASYWFRDLPYNPVLWAATNRDLWWQFVRPQGGYSSNLFSFGNGTNTAFLYTNSIGYQFGMWASNGVMSTNIGTTNYVGTVAANDVLVVSNRSGRVGFVVFQAYNLDANWQNASPANSSQIYPDLAYDGTGTNFISTNYIVAEKAIYLPQGLAWASLTRPAGGSHHQAMYCLEVADARPGRSLNIQVSVTPNQTVAVPISTNGALGPANLYFTNGLLGGFR